MTAIDTTNLRVTFTAPSSGNVTVRVRGVISGTTGGSYWWHLGVLDGATVRFRLRTGGRNITLSGTGAATDQLVSEASGLVTGLTGGTSYTWDAAYGVDTVLASGVFKMGGPNDATGNDAWGQFTFDVWNPGDIPRMIGSAS